ARWYVATGNDKPLNLGVTFVSDYAAALGVDPEETYLAILGDLEVKNLRLVSYWNKIEQEQGVYAFDELDRQFKQAEEVNAKISLAICMRQPRWPECHAPQWALDLPKDKRQENLLTFLEQVVNRYKNSPALKSYQLENEALLHAFGECPDANR